MKVNKFYCYAFMVIGFFFLLGESYLPKSISAKELKHVSGTLNRDVNRKAPDRGYKHYLPVRSNGNEYKFRLSTRDGGRGGKLENEIGIGGKVEVYYYDSCIVNAISDWCRIAFIIKSKDKELVGFEQSFRHYYMNVGWFLHNANFVFLFFVVISGFVCLVFKKLKG